jgi:hypothetical protein
MNTMDKYQQTCCLARPCHCKAPIAFTETAVLDRDLNTEVKHINLYMVDDNMVATSIFSNITEDDEFDDLMLICTYCGADWTSFNLLFS